MKNKSKPSKYYPLPYHQWKVCLNCRHVCLVHYKSSYCEDCRPIGRAKAKKAVNANRNVINLEHRKEEKERKAAQTFYKCRRCKKNAYPNRFFCYRCHHIVSVQISEDWVEFNELYEEEEK